MHATLLVSELHLLQALDKGVAQALNKSGHGGQSASTIEKISDGIRTAFRKLTGKDVPVKDQQYS
ncbi:hypothetical protein RHOSPDRAFT_31831 [Rhodotorula sp. JG-1b]|nr:hypothetical protein RHOSPDRAFT_31831 [Rhodotorula sp. JG-1b]